MYICYTVFCVIVEFKVFKYVAKLIRTHLFVIEIEDGNTLLNVLDTVLLKLDSEEFIRYNFSPFYWISGGFGPCYNCFHEVWMK